MTNVKQRAVFHHPINWCRGHSLHLDVRMRQAGYCAVILDTNQQFSALRIGKCDESFADVFAYIANWTGLLLSRGPLECTLEFTNWLLPRSRAS